MLAFDLARILAFGAGFLETENICVHLGRNSCVQRRFFGIERTCVHRSVSRGQEFLRASQRFWRPGILAF